MSTQGVGVTPLHRGLRDLLIPLVVWVVVFGGRVLCRGCQRVIPVVAVLLPLPLGDTAALLRHRPR